MKKWILSGFLSVLSLSFLLTSCESKDETVETEEVMVEDEANVDVDVNADDTLAEFNRSKAEWDVRITENEKRIATARANLNKMDAKARADYEKRLSDAERRNKELQSQIHEYSYEYHRQQNWQKFKDKFTRDLDAVEGDIEASKENGPLDKTE